MASSIFGSVAGVERARVMPRFALTDLMAL